MVDKSKQSRGMASKEDIQLLVNVTKDLEVSTESMLLKFILHSDKVFG